MKPASAPEASHRAAGRHGDDERQEALVGPAAIALDDEEASRFLKALERPDDLDDEEASRFRTVAKLADLRRRA